MRIYQGAESFVPLRIGLIEHVQRGIISLREYAVFVFILSMTDRLTGTVLSSAKILAEMMHLTPTQVRSLLGQLREKRYLHYDDRRGKRGPSFIFVDKYRIRTEKNRYFYTSIFRDGVFMGEDRFFAQIKLSQLHSKIDEVVSVSFKLNRVPSKFEILFPSEFEALIQSLDSFTQNDAVNRCLTKFKPEFPIEFGRCLFRDIEEEIEIIIQKKQKDPSKEQRPGEAGSDKSPKRSAEHRQVTTEEKGAMATLCGKLDKAYDDFNPFQFVQRCVKADIPPMVIVQVLRQILKYKPDSPWAYGKKVLKEEFAGFQYSIEMERHESLKRMDLSNLSALKVIDSN